MATTVRPSNLANFQAFSDQQINIEHLQPRRQNNVNLSVAEIQEYKKAVAEATAEVNYHLNLMSSGEVSWTAEQAHWVIPGNWKCDRTFYIDLIIGEAIYAQADDVLGEEEIFKHWDLVEAADREEARSFIDSDCFKSKHTCDLNSNNIIDGTWVCCWKKIYSSSNQISWIIKSRMCGRGFLDSQKNSVMKHSSTASRLSQRMVASLYATEPDMVMETWDISTALLQGLKYEELKRHAKKLGIEVRENREVYLAPPPNLWRHFREYKKSTINVSDCMAMFVVLLLLKPIYGTVDAPLLWQLALCLFIFQYLKGIQSVLDDSFLVWCSKGQLAMTWTIHVDDIIVLAKMWFPQWA